MNYLEAKTDEMLRSPLGCAFLSAAAASGLTPVEIASQPNCTYFAAYARKDIEVWQGDWREIRDEILRQGQRHRDLALSILEEPDAAQWFSPLNTERQVYVPYERDKWPPEPRIFSHPMSPLSGTERYSGMSHKVMSTSTLAGGTAGMFVGVDHGLEDMHLARGHKSPYECWLLEADQSARVYEVDGPQAWHDLCVRYPASGAGYTQPPDFVDHQDRLVPDWSGVERDWDAVHVTFGGLLTASQVRVGSEAGWTYMWTWDVEETQWLRWKFTGVERMPDHERPRETPLDELFNTMFVSRANFYRHGPSTTPSPSVTSFYKVPVDFPDLQPAPDEPPDVYLIRRGDQDEGQQAILGHSDWSIDGEVVSNTAPLPIQHPPVLEISESDTLLIKFVAESAPTSLQIRQYGRVGIDGRVLGDPLTTMVWEHPKMYSYRAQENARALTYTDGDGVPGWELELQLFSSVDASYITVFGIWYERGRGACSANWTMSARLVAGR